ncbi:MAG: DUF1538 family protein [Christensenellales bacterium]|jgi:hypothetical protein
MKNLLLKFKESLISVLPVTAIVLVAGFFVKIFDGELVGKFLIGAVMLIAGMALFSLGADIAMVEIGTKIGSALTKTKKLPLIAFTCFIVGIAVTIAEPDLIVLGEQLSGAVNSYLLIFTIGIAVGLFMIVAMLRIYFKVSFRLLMLIFYGIIFVVGIFVPKVFLSLSFDSGGVTTGPMTVPFVMAFGIGIAALKGGGDMEDSFGWVALSSVGPILAVMILGLFMKDTNGAFTEHVVGSESGLIAFLTEMPRFMADVGIALAPIIAFFIIFNFAALKMPKVVFVRTLFGILYVYVGLVLFLTGVNVGFSPVGSLLGHRIVESGYGWLLIPIGVLIGFFIVAAEPAVHVLNEQVEELSGGTIKKRTMMVFLMCGMGAALGLAMTRVLTGLSIWWLVAPGYAISLALSFFVPPKYTAIAFDSGGVASGPMTAAFVLPFAIGACMGRGGNVMTDAFGAIAMVAMTPLITLQLLGLSAVIKTRRAEKQAALAVPAPAVAEEGVTVVAEPDEDDLIIEFSPKDEPSEKPGDAVDKIETASDAPITSGAEAKKTKSATEGEIEAEREKLTDENKPEEAKKTESATEESKIETTAEKLPDKIKPEEAKKTESATEGEIEAEREKLTDGNKPEEAKNAENAPSEDINGYKSR